MVPSLLIDTPRLTIPRGLRKKGSPQPDNPPESPPTLIKYIQRSLDWESELSQGRSIEDIARSEGIAVKRVQELLWLASLSPQLVEQIKRGDAGCGEWSTNQAIAKARRAHKRQAVRDTIARVDEWQRQIDLGMTQAEIARQEGLTRARVTQLMKLSRLPKEVRHEIDKGIGEDELYSIKALIACVGQES